LNAGGRQIAGTQNDLTWDGACATLREGSCRAEPAIRKSLNTAFSPHSDFTLRALVVSITDVNPIPDGPLYCCEFSADIDQGCCPIAITGGLASGPQGQKVDVGEIPGSICVGAPVASTPCD
jgi:hypothetical protein